MLDPDLEIRGAQSLKKIFSAVQASVWSKNKGGGEGGGLYPPQLNTTVTKYKSLTQQKGSR